MINEVNEDDISKLNDTDLRELIGKLCENTLDRYNIDSIGVTYGGKQDESDGGVDVRIKSSAIFDDAWAVPRNNTIFQVKKPKMTPSEIEKEMKKKDGKISKSIKEHNPKTLDHPDGFAPCRNDCPTKHIEEFQLNSCFHDTYS